MSTPCFKAYSRWELSQLAEIAGERLAETRSPALSRHIHVLRRVAGQQRQGQDVERSYTLECRRGRYCACNHFPVYLTQRLYTRHRLSQHTIHPCPPPPPSKSTYSSTTLANFSCICCNNSSYFFPTFSSPSLGNSNFILRNLFWISLVLSLTFAQFWP